MAQGRVSFLLTPLHYVAAMVLVDEELGIFQATTDDLRDDKCLVREAATPARAGIKIRQFSGNSWRMRGCFSGNCGAPGQSCSLRSWRRYGLSCRLPNAPASRTWSGQ